MICTDFGRVFYCNGDDENFPTRSRFDHYPCANIRGRNSVFVEDTSRCTVLTNTIGNEFSFVTIASRCISTLQCWSGCCAILVARPYRALPKPRLCSESSFEGNADQRRDAERSSKCQVLRQCLIVKHFLPKDTLASTIATSADCNLIQRNFQLGPTLRPVPVERQVPPTFPGLSSSSHSRPSSSLFLFSPRQTPTLRSLIIVNALILVLYVSSNARVTPLQLDDSRCSERVGIAGRAVTRSHSVDQCW
jgi:hypothetical protein